MKACVTDLYTVQLILSTNRLNSFQGWYISLCKTVYTTKGRSTMLLSLTKTTFGTLLTPVPTNAFVTFLTDIVTALFARL